MRSDALAKRRAIVVAAKELVAARGAGFPMSAVAEAAGVGAATLHRHFPTRDDLFVGVVEDMRDRLLEVAGRALERMDDDPATAWTDYAREAAALRLGAVLPRLLDDRDVTELPPSVMEMRTAVLGRVAEVLARAQEAGLVRPDVTIERFQLGLGVVSRPLPVDVPGVGGLSEWLLGVYLDGLRP